MTVVVVTFLAAKHRGVGLDAEIGCGGGEEATVLRAPAVRGIVAPGYAGG